MKMICRVVVLFLILLIVISGFTKPTSQLDYILDHNQWRCALYGKHYRWSKVEVGESRVYQFYLGVVRDCVRYDRKETI